MNRLVCIAIALAAAACGGSAEKGPPPTKRQVDSAIGASNLPGARGVRGALGVSDSMDARRKRVDSIAKADSGR